MRRQLARVFCACALLLFCAPPAFADGGGPVLLIINAYAFAIGSVWIILSEGWVYRHRANVPWRTAFLDVFIVNLASTFVIGLGIPLLIAAITVVPSVLHIGPQGVQELLFALGTWVVGDDSPHARLALAMTGIWFAVTFVLTVYFESWLLAKRWRKRGFVSHITPKTLNWHANRLSYEGLVLIALIDVWWQNR